MEWLFDSSLWIALLTLTLLEIVLGIDNIIFISILSSKLPPEQQAKARQVGLGLAMLMRVLLLLSLAWIMKLTTPLLTIWEQAISGRDLILLFGGLFLLAKSTMEIHEKLEGGGEKVQKVAQSASFASIILQILLLDLVFSLDSVITAVGTTSNVPVMITAVIISVLVMMAFAGKISDFVSQHPTIKMLALSFLILIGVTLIAEGLHQHIPKGYIYFAMFFSIGVEILNIRMRRQSQPVRLHDPYTEPDRR